MVSHSYKINKVVKLKKQQGVVLVVSLVFLIALTAVAAALMQNTTTDMKMSGASEEKVFAEQCAVSAVDDYIFQQVTDDNSFAENTVTFQDGEKIIITELVGTKDRCDLKTATLDLANNPYTLPVPCPHTKAASSVQVFECNMLRIQAGIKYGRNKTSTVEINSGIVQQVLK
jgi:Tfp pilus assembly protein PilX